MTLHIPNPELTLEEALRLHTASGAPQEGEDDVVLQGARDKLVEAAKRAWQEDPAEAARVEESLRLIDRLMKDG